MSLITEFAPEEALNEVFPRPPLREVAFEIRFAPRLRVNAELWKIQDKLVEEYPNVGSESVLQPNGGVININLFQNSVTGRVIKVSQENFVLAFTRYNRFEDFKDEISKKVKQFCEEFDVTTLIRIGLRYVNNIVLPASHRTSSLLQYVRPLIDFERVKLDAVEQFVSEIRLRYRNHMATLRGALLAPLEDGRRIYVLDIDCHSDRQHGAVEITSLLDAYHRSAQIIFLDHITDELKVLMRGKS